jgi:ubiquinone/menaquinone biosynthesis C-methylase UbiE
MPKLQDKNYLQNEQYHTEDKLRTRISLHEKFSTNKHGWFLWVFDHFPLVPNLRILELGCGPGDLWLRNIDRIPVSWQITLSDFSPGMVNQARHTLQEQSRRFSFQVIDAQSIPFKDEFFNIVIANHCLYHVPDLRKAISEIFRVLKNGGEFFAATIGSDHLVEISQLIVEFDPTLEDVFQSGERPFTLENGFSQLMKWFGNVEVKRYPDSLHITEVQPLVDYILTTVLAKKSVSKKALLGDFIAARMRVGGGAIDISKDSGIFKAVKS